MIENCTIRLMTLHDLPMVLDWRNHPNVRRFMFTQHEITLDEHRNWYAKANNDASRRLLIVHDAEAPIGCVQFSGVVEGGVADWGFYARPESRKGAGYKLCKMGLNYAFGQLNLHKVCGQAIDTNVASISLHIRMGFIQEGVLREQRYIGGNYHSLICFGLLRHEWQSD